MQSLITLLNCKSMKTNSSNEQACDVQYLFSCEWNPITNFLTKFPCLYATSSTDQTSRSFSASKLGTKNKHKFLKDNISCSLLLLRPHSSMDVLSPNQYFYLVWGFDDWDWYKLDTFNAHSACCLETINRFNNVLKYVFGLLA